MKIHLKEVTIGKVFEGYKNNAEEGVVGYSGRLNIRPPYQREFIYKDEQQQAVIHSILKGFPLNTMYWAVGPDGTYELLDGQQRTISFCEFMRDAFSVDLPLGNKTHGRVVEYSALTEEEQRKIRDYPLMVYVCEGSEAEKLDWFSTINIASLKLTDQELRNAVYSGPWVTNAKRSLSRSSSPLVKLASKYLKGSAIRQDFLEMAIKWASRSEGIRGIDAYMSKHRNDPNANHLVGYFRSVLQWVQDTFPHYRKEMKGVDWGSLYDKYHTQVVDTAALEKEISKLMMDEDVTKKSGIYYYVFDHDPKHLSIRAFTPRQKREAYERQGGLCAICGKHFELDEMEADHIIPWSKGGTTTSDNCQMLCHDCNEQKRDR